VPRALWLLGSRSLRWGVKRPLSAFHKSKGSEIVDEHTHTVHLSEGDTTFLPIETFLNWASILSIYAVRTRDLQPPS